jgi:hypothetical protein
MLSSSVNPTAINWWIYILVIEHNIICLLNEINDLNNIFSPWS